MTIHPSKVLYTLDTQIARYLDGDLGVYRPAIRLDDTRNIIHRDLAPSEHTNYDRQDDATSSPPARQGGYDIWILPDSQ